MKTYIENPKTKGSGIICAIPQEGICPNKCNDCFFQSGRSYLEPLSDNLPNIPTKEQAMGKIVRMNDGNDSNVKIKQVIKVAHRFKDYFYNTAIPVLSKFDAPVVLTVNPHKMTDTDWHKIQELPNLHKLMFVRIRTNTWNIDNVVIPAINYYTLNNVRAVITFMAYFTEAIPEAHKDNYAWKKRTLNSYWVLKQEKINWIMNKFKDNPLVYSCGVKGQYSCSYCGNCIREYYNTKIRLLL